MKRKLKRTKETKETKETEQTNEFSHLVLEDFEPLEAATKRKKCPGCNITRKYFCYQCQRPIVKLPTVSLPIPMDIIHHPTECLSKSTAVHAVVLCGKSQVNFIDFPEIPQYDAEETVLLYPSESSVSVSELSEEDIQKIKRVVVVDSQWQKTRGILSHKNLSLLKCVKITDHKTSFWRYQKHGDSYLATIEAIYYFYREYFGAANKDSVYKGEYDNLLYLYVFMYRLIQKYYKDHTELNFRHKDNYIQYTKEEEEKHAKKEEQLQKKKTNKPAAKRTKTKK